MSVKGGVYVTNQRGALKPVTGATRLKKTISSTAVTVAGDSALATPLHADTECLLVQNQGNDVYYTCDGTTPAAGDGLLLVSNTIVIVSRSEWLNSKWIRASADATLLAFQLRST